MNLLILLSIPGPTIVSPAPDRSPYLEVETQNTQPFIQDVEDLILEHPEVSRKRSGSLGGLTRLSFRGSRSLQNRMSLDGLALSTGFGGLQAWRLIEPALLNQLRIDSGGSPSGLNPIGGHVDLQTTGSEPGPWLGLSTGSNAHRHLSLGHRGPQIQLGASLSEERGDFLYFDDRGTLFHQEDDRWVRRKNNQRQRINSLISWQRSPYRSQLFLAQLVGGVPGPGHRQTEATEEAIHLSRLSLSHRRPNRRLQLYLGRRLQQHFDPQGEWGMGTIHGESLQQDQVGWLGHWRQHRKKQKLRLMLGAEWNRYRGSQSPEQMGLLNMDLHWQHPRGLSLWLGGRQQLLELWDAQKSQWAISPGLAFHHRSTNLLFRFQSMARLPSLLERYGRSFFLQGNPELRRESGWGIDTLWRHQHGRVSLYARHMEDLIEWDQNAQFSSRPRNRAHAQVLGLSILARGAGFQLGYRIQQTWAFDDPIDDEADRLAGEPLHRLRIQWRHRWQQLSYGFRWDLQDGFFLDRANLRPVAPSYPLDLHVSYAVAASPIRISLRLSNLFNQRQHRVQLLPGNHAVDLALADQAGYPLPGRRWFVGLEMR